MSDAVKLVLIPGMLLHPDGDALLAAAPEVEVIYAQSEEERAHGYFAPERLDIRRAAIETALDRWLPEIHALHGLGVGGHMPIPGETLRRAERLEVLFNSASGVDRMDVPTATELGILVVNAAGENAPAVAEQTLGLMLSLARRIADSDRIAHAERRVQPGRLGTTSPRLSLVSGKTVGLVGFGHIGRAVAGLLQAAFDSEILVYDPYLDPDLAAELGVEPVADLHEMLPRCDFVSVHTPLTDATRNLIGAAELAAMKPSAYLLNTARGATVDTAALVAALERSEIAGAGLDVTEPEPLPDGHPLFELENVILTPHSGGNSPELLRPMTMSAIDGLLTALRGERPRHLVNPEAWERRRVQRVRA